MEKEIENFIEISKSTPIEKYFDGLEYRRIAQGFETKKQATDRASNLKTLLESMFGREVLLKTVNGLDENEKPCFINYYYLAELED